MHASVSPSAARTDPSGGSPAPMSSPGTGQHTTGPDASALHAVLWDMDGTLVDTEPYWIAAELELVADHGGVWSHEQAHAMVGQSLTYSAGYLQAAGVQLSVREIIDHLIGEVVAQVRREVPWRPGARELLAELRASGIRCALVTMSEAPLAREIDRVLPPDSFEFLITGDMVTAGKPAPEPYLTALDRLRDSDPGIDAPHVVAFEDSLPGVTSAQAAGLVTVGIPHFIELPDDDGRVIWPTLAGRTVADVVALVNNEATPKAGRRP